MSASAEQAPNSEPNYLETYRDYSLTTKKRLNDADYMLTQFHQLLPNTEPASYGAVNQALEQAGRPDLAITAPAQMLPADRPEEIMTDKYWGFARGFNMYTDLRPVGKIEEGGHLEVEQVPLTEEKLLQLKQLQRFQTQADFQRSLSTDYPFLKHHSHAHKPAFIRLLNLFTEQTVELVQGVSDPANKDRRAAFEPQIFAAYVVMSHLVDEGDLGVTRDGQVDPKYLS